MRVGKGHKTYKNGDEYIGTWSKDMRHGRGKLSLADGSVYEG